MRVLALDIGERRVGVASGDTATRVATPVKVLATEEVVGNARTWRTLVQDEEPELIVAGLPTSMNGEQGRQARRVKDMARKIARQSGLPLEFSDERLSSSEARRILHEQGLSEKEMRGRVDMVAASLFLETWMDRREAAGREAPSGEGE